MCVRALILMFLNLFACLLIPCPRLWNVLFAGCFHIPGHIILCLSCRVCFVGLVGCLFVAACSIFDCLCVGVAV